MDDNFENKKANWFDLLATQPDPKRCNRTVHDAGRRPMGSGSPASASQRGRQGVREKARLRQPVKDFAINLAKQKRYRSAYACSHAIAKATCAYAATNEIYMSEMEAPKTIVRWLKDAFIVFILDDE